jgi:hypothetical protein
MTSKQIHPRTAMSFHTLQLGKIELGDYLGAARPFSIPARMTVNQRLTVISRKMNDLTEEFQNLPFIINHLALASPSTGAWTS